MEDFKNTKEDQSSTISPKVFKQLLKGSSPPAPLTCVTLRSSSTPSLSPSPTPGGPALHPAGENNAKKSTVANGQVSSSVSVWRTAREVPPRFRNYQEPKILLKRGQSLDGISPFLHTGDQSNANTLQCSASLSYANSTCGPGSGAPPPSQGMDRIVVDGSELQAWCSDTDSRRQNEFLDEASWECNESMPKNSESVSPTSCATPVNLAEFECMQQTIQSQDGGQSKKKEVGPKQAEADPADSCKGFSSNLDALIPVTCRTSEKPLETTGEMWGTSGESQSNITENSRVSHEISESGWDEIGGGLKKQAATDSLSDVPKEGEVKERPSDCLQDTQTTATSLTTTGSEKGVTKGEWDGSECESVGHRGSEDGTPHISKAQTSCTSVTVQSMLSRSDLDPKVFSNTGWGQTKIKQSVAWDLEVDSNSESGRDCTEHAQIDLNISSCPQWLRDLQVKETRSKGAGSKEEQSEKKPDKHALPGKGNSWVEVVEDEQVGSWDGNKKVGEQQREGDGGGWGLGDSHWGENKSREKSWVNSEDEGRRSKQHQGWGESRHPQHVPSNQPALKDSNQQQLQQSQLQLTQLGASQESRNPPTSPAALNQSSGWKPSLIPHTASHPEPSGWEEPSPQSISRKMEIDDGTSAWGDPAHYDKKSVNMWDKTNLQQKSQPCPQQHKSIPDTTPISRDKNADPISSAWEPRAGASEQVLDNSKAGWRKTIDASAGWRNVEDSGKGAGWSSSLSNPAKTGSTTMQDGWCDEGLNTSRHSSWEEEDNGSGMWGSRSQDSTSSFSSGGWNQTQGGRRLGAKGSLRGDSAGSWTGSITRQMSNMGMTDEEPISASDRNRRWINDFNGEMRRGGRGGGGGSFRSHSSSKEPGVTGVFNSSGVSHFRGMQPGVHHINPSPGVRAQVPQPFLPPQVSGSVLNPMFPPQLSPQQLAMLSGIHPHVQQVQLAHQLLMQQQQQQQQHVLSHRKFSHPPLPLIQHQDPQQLARIMALLQQRPKPPVSFPGILPGPVKLRGDSSYPHYDMVGVENVGVASPDLIDNWHQNIGGKLSPSPSTPTWPPEFQPGVPWKGVQSPEPDQNPYSAMLGENTLTDTEHHLLQDNTVSLSEINTVLPSPAAWPYCASDTHNPVKFPALATGWPPDPIGHRANRNSSQLPRPPPGLTHQKQSSWLGVGPHMPRGWGSERPSQESLYGTESSWSAGSSTGSSWLLLSNLTPQIDSSTLKTICLQHGPLMTFNLGLAQGSALIRYCSPEEAAKAQSALHMCVLGNTTIMAEFVSEEDVARYFTHSHSGETACETETETGGGEEVKLGWESLDGVGLSLFNQWSHSRGGGVWGGAPSGYHGNLWGSPQVEDTGPGLLPGNLLGGGADTL